MEPNSIACQPSAGFEQCLHKAALEDRRREVIIVLICIAGPL